MSVQCKHMSHALSKLHPEGTLLIWVWLAQRRGEAGAYFPPASLNDTRERCKGFGGVKQ